MSSVIQPAQPLQTAAGLSAQVTGVDTTVPVSRQPHHRARSRIAKIVLSLLLVGFACLFAAAVLMRIRAELAEAKVEARMRRAAAE